MRLVTFTHARETRIGALSSSGDVIDLRAAAPALPGEMIAFLAAGEAAMGAASAAVRAAEEREMADRAGAVADGLIVPFADVGIAAPVPRPGKVLAIGLNYRDHAAESGQEIPKRPIVFAKVSTCIVGPGHPVYVARVSSAIDWEGELCFVIGKKARYVSAADAYGYVAGYTIGNDVSVRDWQFHSPTWMMGKSFDTHGPLGPWLVTPDEIDVSDLEVRTFVNDELKQHSSTKQLIFDVPAIIEYLSAGFTLEPGDVVYTGTPAGVGAAGRPPVWLKPGDVVRVEITGLGALENPVAEEPA